MAWHRSNAFDMVHRQPGTRPKGDDQTGVAVRPTCASSQGVAAKQLYRACLWSLLAALLEEGDARTGNKVGKPIVQHAVLVKIDFMSIRGFKKAECLIKTRHGADRLALVCLYLAAQPPVLVL
jgi:hypothetical protein